MKIFSTHPKLGIIYSVVEDNIDCFYDEYWDQFNQQTDYKTFHSFVVAKEWEKENLKPLKPLNPKQLWHLSNLWS